MKRSTPVAMERSSVQASPRSAAGTTGTQGRAVQCCSVLSLLCYRSTGNQEKPCQEKHLCKGEPHEEELHSGLCTGITAFSCRNNWDSG